MKTTLAAAAAVAVLGFSGAALAQESGNFDQYRQSAAALDSIATASTGVGYSTQAVQAEPRFRWNEDGAQAPVNADRIVTSSTDAGYQAQPVRHEPRFRWNEN